jgi:hypothetical protein
MIKTHTWMIWGAAWRINLSELWARRVIPVQAFSRPIWAFFSIALAGKDLRRSWIHCIFQRVRNLKIWIFASQTANSLVQFILLFFCLFGADLAVFSDLGANNIAVGNPVLTTEVIGDSIQIYLSRNLITNHLSNVWKHHKFNHFNVYIFEYFYI